MNKVQLSNKHLIVINKALEVYYRLKSGQISIALDSAFDCTLPYDQRDICEQFLRSFTHINLQPNSYYGVSSKIMGDAQIAYEIQKTFQEFLAVTNNNGFYGNTVDFHGPLKVSTEELPIVENFTRYKDYKIPKRLCNKILDLCAKEDYRGMWDYIDQNVPKLPKGEKKEIIHLDKKMYIRVWKPYNK